MNKYQGEDWNCPNTDCKDSQGFFVNDKHSYEPQGTKLTEFECCNCHTKWAVVYHAVFTLREDECLELKDKWTKNYKLIRNV